MANLGTATVHINADISSMNKALKKTQKSLSAFSTSSKKAMDSFSASKISPQLDMAGKSIQKFSDSSSKSITKLGNTFSKIFTGVIIWQIGKGIAAMNKLAVDAVESENLFNVSMGNMAAEARAFSETMADTLGLDPIQVRKNIAMFNDMTKSMGLSEQQAFELSKNLTQLGFDFSSFYNLRPEEAFTKISAAIAGEVEPLRRYGKLINETSTKNAAIRHGIAEQGKSLTEAQKPLGRYEALIEQTTTAQGDLARTLQSPANQLRILKTQMIITGRNIAGIWQPALAAILPMLTQMARNLAKITGEMSRFVQQLTGFNASALVSSDSFQKSDKAISDLGASAKKAGKDAKKGLAGFDELNDIAKATADSAGNAGEQIGIEGFMPTAVGTFDPTDVSMDATIFDPILNKISTIRTKISEFYNEWGMRDFFSNFGAGLTKLDFSRVSDSIGNLFNSISSLVLRSMPGLKSLFKTIGSTLGATLGNAISTFGNITADTLSIATNKIAQWIATNQGPIVKSYSNTFSILETITRWFGRVTDGVLNSISNVWNERFKGIFSGVISIFTDIAGWFLKFYNNTLIPLFSRSLGWLQKIWDDNLSGLFDELLGFVGRLGEISIMIYQKFIKPFIDYYVDELLPILTNVWITIIDLIGNFANVVVNVVKNVFGALNGLLDYLVGVFTGDWEKAWEGVKKIYTSIWDAIAGIFKGVVNGIIAGINFMIRALNGIRFTIPDFVPEIGGQAVGFNLSEIPQLADGGIVSSPTLAMIGEAGSEAVVPLENESFTDSLASKVGTVVLNALQFAGGGNNASDQELVLNIDGTEIARALLPNLASEQNRIGKTAIAAT